MKKYLLVFAMFALVSGVYFTAAPVQAQAQSTWYMKRVTRNGRTRYVRVKKPNVYRRHRNLINMGIGTGAGALIGGLVGGGKGALIGAGAGAGGSALYTYVFNKKKRKYVRVRRY